MNLGFAPPATERVAAFWCDGDGGMRPVVVRASLRLLAASAEEWSTLAKASPPSAVWAEGRRFGAEELLAKDAGAKVYTDSEGQYRWITVHPHGSEERGVPVKIRASKTQPGVWHVVAGAGGKLNYLKLTDVKSPEEYKARAKEKAEARKEAAKSKAETRQRQLDEMTPEEREASGAATRLATQRKEEAQQHLETQKRQFVADVAQALGWPAEEWQFDATRKRLEAAGADPERVLKLEAAHFKRLFTRAQDAVKATKRQVLLDHELRATAELGDLPLNAADAEVVALSDLDPDRAGKGLGYQRDVGKLSDAELTRQLASADTDRLRAELAEAKRAQDPDDPESWGRTARLRQELHVAEVLREMGEQPPEVLHDRDAALAAEIQQTQAGMGEYGAELRTLRAQFQAAETSEDRERILDDGLGELEAQQQADLEKIEALKVQRDDVGILLGRQGAAVKGEKIEQQRKRQAEREREIRVEQGEAGVVKYRAMREAMEMGLARYRAEIAELKASGALKAPNVKGAAISDPKQAIEVLKRAKAIAQLERDTDRAVKGDKPIDEKLFGKPYFVESRALDKAVAADLENTIAETRTRAFLSELEAGERDPVLADLEDGQRREALERHVSAGSYNALNNAALAILKNAAIPRDVADVLGAAGTAQLLAHAIRASRPDDLDVVREAIEDYHLANHTEQSAAAVTEARGLFDQAKEVELGAAENVPDLATLQELNGRRRDLLLKARERLGFALGEMEANAALVMALRSGPVKEIPVALGPVAAEAAIRQARAIGLGRDDYALDFDGTNRFLTVKASGLDKLVAPANPAELAATEEVLAIKRGERDEEGWLAPGLTTRPQTSFDDPGRVLPSLGAHQMQTRPFDQWGVGEAAGLSGGGTAGDPVADLEDHIGARIADGEHPDRVIGSVVANLHHVPAEHRTAIAAHLDHIAPTTVPLEENGKPVFKTNEDGSPVLGADGQPVQRMRQVLASHHQGALNALAEQYVAKHLGDSAAAPFHAQGLKLDTPADTAKTVEALHRSIAADPRTIAAFKAPAELTPQEKGALRHYFNSELAAGQAGIDKAAVERAIADLGPEPPEKITDQADMFSSGPTTNPEWTAWKAKQRAVLADAHDAAGGLEWNAYVATHKSVRHAYEAIQDHMKGALLGRFASAYDAQHGAPLRVGQQRMRNADRHLAALDPDARVELKRERDALANAAQQRTAAGQYATGSYKERLDRMAQAEQIADQNQVSLLPAAEGKDQRKWSRTAIGERAENQLASLMGNVGRNFRHQMTQPVGLTPNLRMSGAINIGGQQVDITPQQRTIKSFLAKRRLGAFLGVGSGKSAISIGSFTAAASDPASGVKRGLWIVPSQVQGQFHGEMAQFVEPGKFQWHSAPGAAAEDRMAAHRDAGTHMVVQTHQGFRDDMVRLLAEHHGKGDGIADWFMGLPRAERAAALKAAWRASGIDYHASFIDEGHVTLDRRGKEDSLLSAVLTAASDNTPYYMAMTADPAKNDVSEIRSQLDKLHPDGRFGDEAAWHKRYGLNTSASREALRREVSGNFFINHIQPDVETRHAEETVPLHPEQQKQYGAVMQQFQQARADRAKGRINVEAIKALSPSSFAGQPETEHEAVARRLSDNLGILKEAALHRVVNLAPAEHNAKLQAVRARLKDHHAGEKPVVVFAHNLEAVRMIEEGLKADGHRVTTLTGEHATKEKDARRRAFAPKGGEAPTADVIVLSDAGATGLNLQRGQTLIQYDIPQTAMVHAQRNGRIRRLGQQRDVDLIDYATDSPYEARARQRLQRKYDLRSIFETDAVGGLDEHDLGAFLARAKQRRTARDEASQAQVAA